MRKISALTSALILFWCSAVVAQTPAESPPLQEPLGSTCPPGYFQSPNDNPGADLKLGLAEARLYLQASKGRSAYAAALPSAQQGDAEAQTFVAQLLGTGCAVAMDKKAAADFALKAAKQGIPRAQAMIAGAYARGEGIEASVTEAFFWMKKAADAGLPGAQTSLGVMYLTGTGTTSDLREGISWSIKAAEQGNAAALMNVAIAYQLGRGLPKNLERAVFWAQAAGDRGNAAQKARAQQIQQTAGATLSIAEIDNAKAASRDWRPGPNSLSNVRSDMEMPIR